MEQSVWPLVLDGVIIILLATTIFFAARLSLYLREFRANRKSMDKLVNDLASHILRAEKSVAGMREAARESGRDLQALINESKAVIEEMQFICQSGNNIAGRLEKLSENKGRAVAAVVQSRQQRQASRSERFMIRDPEFGGAQEEEESDESSFSPPQDGFTQEEDFSSRAERDLYESLYSRKKKADAGGVS